MSNCARLLLALAALLIAGTASAQAPRDTLGAELQDVSKDEAEKLGWEAPRGVKVVRPLANGAAARAGLGKAQNFGDLRCGELLEMLEGQNFSVDRVHPVERLLHQHPRLGLDRGLRRSRQRPQKLSG